MATARLHLSSWALAPCLSTLAAAVVPAQQTFLVGGEFQVNAFTSSSQGLSAIALNDADDFVVTWQSDQQDGAAYGVFARRFDVAGAPQGAEFQVDSSTLGFESAPAVAMASGGRFVVSWTSFGPDGSGNGVFAQRLVTLALLDADADGSTGALTDGLLVLRFLFGFTGPTLTSGAVGAGCVRCTGVEIEDYLAAAPEILDVDGDLSTDPLTDGLLALRFLFGFTGPTLTSGAVGEDCERCDADEIEPYLESLI